MGTEKICKCGGGLEMITSTKPSLKTEDQNYRSERQIFHACNRCRSLYDTKEVITFTEAGTKVSQKTAPYDGLCKAELSYMPQLEGILDFQAELEVVKEFAHEGRMREQ